MTEERSNTNKKLNGIYWKVAGSAILAFLIGAIGSCLKEIQRLLSGFPAKDEKSNDKEKK